MDGLKDAEDNGAAEDAEFFDSTSLLEGTKESNAAAENSTVAVSATPENRESADDPLTLFSWTLRHRANSQFANGPYEARLILGSDCVIQSSESADDLMQWMHDKCAAVVKKLES
jgi:hypothetical protein